MGCCGQRSTSTTRSVPRTSGDFAAAPGMPRFKVVSKTEVDEDGEPVVLSRHPDYRSASIASQASGGRIRNIK